MNSKMRRILMIAYHFPPMGISSGIQRTLRFVQHLPDFGWLPAVLTADPRAYEKTSNDLLSEIPADVIVHRAFALDTARQLAIGGRYIGAMARPDRWVSWRFDAVRQGMRMIRELKPDVLWSTYPIATAHLIGAELHRRSGLPWIADFRDPMVQVDYPPDPLTRKSFERIEAAAARQAFNLVFTTPGAAADFRARYPGAADRVVVVENGFDEESFPPRTVLVSDSARTAPERLLVLHSGIVYPSERDPTALFVALGRLRKQGLLRPGSVCFRFRAAVHDRLLRSLAAENDVESFVEVCPSIPYRDALAEMLQADALMVMQAANCNAQIPAKIYEYLRAGRPIITLTDPAGDTAGVVRDFGLDAVARLDSADEICALLPRFVAAVRGGQAPLPDPVAVGAASRRARTEALATLLRQSSGITISLE